MGPIQLSLIHKIYKLNLIHMKNKYVMYNGYYSIILFCFYTGALSKLGRIKTNEITKLILRKFFTDKLGMTYSWCGGKDKRIISS